MAQGFITNSGVDTLKARINQVIAASDELKFLVGFFYFSGIDALYSSIKKNEEVVVNILVGLQVEKTIHGMYEYAEEGLPSSQESVKAYFESLKKSFNSDEFDTKEFYEQIAFFIDLMTRDKLRIRKTLDPNHAKLYIFKFKQDQVGKPMFITGSSNLTRAGLGDQQEFNVDISDYGFTEANEYFDELWNSAIKITEIPELKQQLINILENDTHTKKVTPYEAYALVLKHYIDSFPKAVIGENLKQLMLDKDYQPYEYQMDAAKQAISIIQEHNGVIVADVVGLGKSVIAGIIANQMNVRGLVICPPGLMGKSHPKSGWHQYVDDFDLDRIGWSVHSRGDLKNIEGFVREHPDIELIIIDEAHNFRNQDTEDYETLSNICRGKKVMLLTATPFNNSPGDLLSLISLFISPKKSNITLDDNVKEKFRVYNADFKKLATIKKSYRSSDQRKQQEAKKAYKSLFGDEDISIPKVNGRIKLLSSEIKSVIEPVTVRRNRLDLINHAVYSQEIAELSKVDKPVEWFYYLNDEQSEFYDKIIEEYFSNPDEGGRFSGAIYQPYAYEVGEDSQENQTEEGAFARTSQRNLYDFMRRLVVKRFESSAKAFEDTLKRFIGINERAKEFISSSGGMYVLERKIIDKLFSGDPDEIDKALKDYEEKLSEKEVSKTKKPYNVNQFSKREKFFQDIDNDIQLFKEILAELERLKFSSFDPKLNGLIENIQKQRRADPVRKLIIFSEYADTVQYVGNKLNAVFPGRVLTVYGTLSDRVLTQLRENFDAKNSIQKNEFDILVATDRLSEGFNLNRAGMVINYDIPWNPVRVIQRLGRINRMSRKVFDTLQIANFFPSERGADIVKSREIAQHKMFLIHNALGEDAQIFDDEEEPNESKLFERLNTVDENAEGESFYTRAYNDFENIRRVHPELVEQLQTFPQRIKVAKKYDPESLMVFIKKGRLFVREHTGEERKSVSLEQVYDKLRCKFDTPAAALSDDFWVRYKSIRSMRQQVIPTKAENNIEIRALNNLKSLRGRSDLDSTQGFIRALIEDVEEYGTLPDYTLRKISEIPNNGEVLEIGATFNELERALGGADYLDVIKENNDKTKKEIIIAVENQT